VRTVIVCKQVEVVLHVGVQEILELGGVRRPVYQRQRASHAGRPPRGGRRNVRLVSAGGHAPPGEKKRTARRPGRVRGADSHRLLAACADAKPATVCWMSSSRR